MLTIERHKNFQLGVTATAQPGGEFSVELKQFWPEAQRPHWRRIAQLNLSREQLKQFSDYLAGASEAGAA